MSANEVFLAYSDVENADGEVRAVSVHATRDSAVDALVACYPESMITLDEYQEDDWLSDNGAVHLYIELHPVFGAKSKTWRLTAAGAWVHLNDEGASIGNVFRNPSGTWTGSPWGRAIANFETAAEAKAHVEAMFRT